MSFRFCVWSYCHIQYIYIKTGIYYLNITLILLYRYYLQLLIFRIFSVQSKQGCSNLGFFQPLIPLGTFYKSLIHMHPIQINWTSLSVCMYVSSLLFAYVPIRYNQNKFKYHTGWKMDEKRIDFIFIEGE